ncbi:MAG: SDR family oxidoreductase, partial [Rhodospirillaceae bacterium]|nr:SDR family oxidoreductase [Rhodospirillaceae bacterium]
TVDAAATELKARPGQGRVIGIACDVADFDQVQNLWRQTAKVFGRIDIWINNAGVINKYRPLQDLDRSDIDAVVATNLAGAMAGTRVAAAGMATQEPDASGLRGAIYNMEGFGSDGMTRAGLSVYGTTKRALTYFSGAAAKDLRNQGIVVGTIQPGLVVTELGLGESCGKPVDVLRREKKFISAFGDPVGPVAAFVAARVLANRKPGARINWLGPGKLAWRVLTAPLGRRDPIGEAGLP